MTADRAARGERAGAAVLVADTALVDALGPLPPGYELVALGAGEEMGPHHRACDIVVLAAELRDLLPRLGEMPSLRLVQTLNAGVEMMLPHVPAGVTLCNASGVHDGPVAEWVVGALIASRRGIPRFVAAQAARRWDTAGNALTTAPSDIPFDDLDDVGVLIVGHGSIGRRVEAMLQPFGAHVTGVAFHERPGVHRPDDLDDLLPAAAVVVLLAPLTAATTGLLDRRRLALLPDGATVINVARGAMLDQAALEDELRSGRLRAVLDVTDPEPLPSDASLWTAPNLLITPHTAGSSRRWLERAYRLVGDQLRRDAAGEPLLNVRSAY